MEGTPTTGVPLPGQTPAEAADIAENKDLAALSYVWVLSLVIYFSKHNSPFVRFHAKQGLVLFAFSLIFAMLPTLSTLLLLVILALSVLGFLNAAQGLKKDLPIIGPIARADIPALKESCRSLWHSFKNLFHRAKKAATGSAPKTEPARQEPVKPQPAKTEPIVVEPIVVEASKPETPVQPAPPVIPSADLPPSAPSHDEEKPL